MINNILFQARKKFHSNTESLLALVLKLKINNKILISADKLQSHSALSLGIISKYTVNLAKFILAKPKNHFQSP